MPMLFAQWLIMTSRTAVARIRSRPKLYRILNGSRVDIVTSDP